MCVRVRVLWACARVFRVTHRLPPLFVLFVVDGLPVGKVVVHGSAQTQRLVLGQQGQQNTRATLAARRVKLRGLSLWASRCRVVACES